MKRRYRILDTGELSKSQLAEARHIVHQILTDNDRGWLGRYGVVFEETSKEDLDPNIINVRFISNDNMRQKFPGLDGLSAYDISANNIYFNIDNWTKGGKDPFPIGSKGESPLMRYRTYVINHEFGHALGLDHVKPTNRNGLPGSIMMQMTKGKNHIAPCTLNEWPLKKADFNEYNLGKIIPSMMELSRNIFIPNEGYTPGIYGGGCGCMRGKIIAICVLFLLVILAFFLLCFKHKQGFNITRFNDRFSANNRLIP